MSLSREPNMREWLESLHKEKQKDENQEAQRMDKLITDLRSENDRLKAQIEYKDKITAELVEQRDRLQAMHDHMKAMNDSQAGLLLQQMTEIADLKTNLDTESNRVFTLTDQQDSLRTRYDALVTEIQILQKTVTEKIENSPEYKNLQTALRESQRDVVYWTTRQEGASDGLRKTAAERNRLKEDLKNVKATLAKRDAEVANHRKYLDEQRDKLAGRVGALQHSNNELGRKYQITMNRYNKLLERVKKMEMATKLKVPDPGEFVTSPIAPTMTRDQLTEWIRQLQQANNMLQFNLEHQTNVRLAKEKELAELRKIVYELQKATSGIEYEYMEPARSGRDFVTYFAFEARSQKDTPTGRRRISF